MFCLFPLDCGNLLPPENGMLNLTLGMHGNNTLFATATYTCELGFYLSDSTQRTCKNTSEWLPVAPNCTLSRKVHIYFSLNAVSLFKFCLQSIHLFVALYWLFRVEHRRVHFMADFCITAKQDNII